MLDYVPIAAGAGALKEAVDKAEKSFAEEAQRVHYLSVPPNAALSAIKMLSEAQLAGGSRVIMEKPFGTDLESAVALNDALHKVFAEDQIFRIDHFLGKEPAQNILAFRFANGLFEPIWNRNFIDHVQIDVPETLDIGNRIAFYEQTGAYRDMVVTHLFQILGFMAMEPPTSLAPGQISEEKNKVFRSLMPIDPAHVVRGQFIGYRKEPGVDPESTPRLSSRSNASSTIGAGRACRSTCGPASAWPKASASSRSLSANPRRACSRAIPALDRKGRIT